MTKTQIRQDVRSRIEAMDSMTRYARSLAACKQLTRLSEFADAHVAMIYLSLVDEVDTTVLALSAWQAGKTVLAPKMFWEHRRILPVEIQSLDTGMVVGRHGLREPAESRPIPLEMIELVVVPAQAFDRRGHRIGRGVGCYDRFLSQSGLQAVTCGLGFHEQLYDEVPTEDHDHPIDMLVTDEEVLRFH